MIILINNFNPTRYFIFNFLVISLIFFKNKCLYDVIWDLKREKKKFGKRRIRTLVDSVKMTTVHALPSVPLDLMIYCCFL